MIFLTLGLIGLHILYWLIQWNFISHWKKIASISSFQNNSPIRISVIITVRNEANHIEQCLRSIADCSFPKSQLEILVMDDQSEDDTVERIRALEFPFVKVIPLKSSTERSPKKQALLQGVPIAQGEIIACTDGDCIVPKEWLTCIQYYFQEFQITALALPVELKGNSTVLDQFQQLDFAGMMVVTAGGIHSKTLYSANGANLAFKKSGFSSQIFNSNQSIASGDDVFMIQTMSKKDPDSIRFAKERKAIVRTGTQIGLRDFIHQRIRWGSKSTSYNSVRSKAVLAVVYLNCIAILVFFIAGLYEPIYLILSFLVLVGKSTIDFFLLRQATNFFRRPDLLTRYPVMSILHWIYILVIGTLSLIRVSYDWKGRSWR